MSVDPNHPTTLHVRRAKDGDGESLAWLVRRLSPLLYAQARLRLGPALRRSIDPDDLVQDVWSVALPALPELEAHEGRETPVLVRFLATTLLYRVNELARRQARRAGEGDPPPASEVEPPDGSGVVTRFAREEARGAVIQAIDSLDERDRQVVVLRGIEQVSNENAAELLGESANAVSLRYNRALAKLRAKLPASIFDELPSDGNSENS